MSIEKEASRFAKLVAKYPLGAVLVSLNAGIILGLIAALFV